jgi:hypothetical protein
MHTKARMKTFAIVQNKVGGRVMRIPKVQVNFFSKKEFSMLRNVIILGFHLVTGGRRSFRKSDRR